MRFRNARSIATTLLVSYGALSAVAACSGNSSPAAPTRLPTMKPTATATAAPTASPTPTAVVSATPTPTGAASATPTPSPTIKPTATPTASPTAQPQVIHVGFQHTATTDPTFGMIAFYSPGAGAAAIITVVHGSQVVFLNDGAGVPHTGSGLGTGPFPAGFDNTSGTTQSGTTIDGSLTWSTGTLTPGSMSQVFTVGAPGDYFFGCFFHYVSNGMRDVLVST